MTIKNNAENKYVSNFIFDFGGQERFKRLIPKFLEGANGALLVFDSVSFSSFQKLEFWYKMLIENVDINIPKILVASKCDLLEKTPKVEIVDQKLIDKFIREKQLDDFFRTSALENYNVLEVFKELTNLMLKRQKINTFVI